MKSREGSGQHDIYSLQFYNSWYRIQRRKEKFRDTAKENPRCQKSLSAEFCATGFYVAWEKQPTFRDAKTGFPTQWRCLRNERRNFKLVTCHCPDLGSDTSSVWNFSVLSAGKPVLRSWIAGCFLRLVFTSYEKCFKSAILQTWMSLPPEAVFKFPICIGL